MTKVGPSSEGGRETARLGDRSIDSIPYQNFPHFSCPFSQKGRERGIARLELGPNELRHRVARGGVSQVLAQFAAKWIFKSFVQGHRGVLESVGSWDSSGVAGLSMGTSGTSP